MVEAMIGEGHDRWWRVRWWRVEGHDRWWGLDRYEGKRP